MRPSSAALVVDRPLVADGLTGPRLLVGAGVTALVVTAAAAFVDPAIARPGAPAYLVSGVVMTAVDLAVAFAFVRLASSGATARARFAQLAFSILVASSFAMVVAEALLRVDFALGNSLFQVLGPLQALGLVLVGAGVIRARRWSGWRRFVPLALGLYVPLVMVPLLVASGGTSLLALGGYHALVLALGIGWGIEADRESAVA